MVVHAQKESRHERIAIVVLFFRIVGSHESRYAPIIDGRADIPLNAHFQNAQQFDGKIAPNPKSEQ